MNNKTEVAFKIIKHTRITQRLLIFFKNKNKIIKHTFKKFLKEKEKKKKLVLIIKLN
jgi:hypothetical protein